MNDYQEVQDSIKREKELNKADKPQKTDKKTTDKKGKGEDK